MADRVCLYALVAGAAGPLTVSGISGERLRVVRIEGIDAVIGMMPRVPAATSARMRRYDEVERALTEIYGSVLPARYGTCAATVRDLAPSVRDRRAAIRRNLRLVRGRTQMTLRLFTRSESVSNQPRVRSESVSNQPRVSSEPVRSRFRVGSECGDGATQGTQYLRRRMAETQIPGSAPLRAAVARWVRAERMERVARGRLAGSIYHLIPRGSVAAYRRAMERAATDGDVKVIISGPWPPYAFASE